MHPSYLSDALNYTYPGVDYKLAYLVIGANISKCWGQKKI